MPKPNSPLPAKLPKRLYRFFWDTDTTKVNPRTHPDYVINRLLDKGDLAAARWVVKNFSKEKIIDAFRNTRDASFKTVNFWSKYLNFSPLEAKCMQAPYRAMRKQVWPR